MTYDEVRVFPVVEISPIPWSLRAFWALESLSCSRARSPSEPRKELAMSESSCGDGMEFTTRSINSLLQSAGDFFLSPFQAFLIPAGEEGRSKKGERR